MEENIIDQKEAEGHEDSIAYTSEFEEKEVTMPELNDAEGQKVIVLNQNEIDNKETIPDQNQTKVKEILTPEQNDPNGK